MKTILSLLAFTTLALQATDKPNVVLFLVDDMGWMDCGVYGSKYYETPHMDKLAKQSMLFHRRLRPPALLADAGFHSQRTVPVEARHNHRQRTPARPPRGQSRYPKGAPA